MADKVTETDLAPFLDARQNQLQLEVAKGEGVDTKGLGVLASDLAILVFIGQAPDLTLHDWRVTLLVMAFGISFVISVVAIWPRSYSGASVSLLEHPEYGKFSSSKLVRQLIADTEQAIYQNQRTNRLRLWQYAISLVITTLAALMLFLMLYFK